MKRKSDGAALRADAVPLQRWIRVMSNDGATPPAAWYPDPTDPNRMRYWDGQAWTADTKVLPPPNAVATQAPTHELEEPTRTETLSTTPLTRLEDNQNSDLEDSQNSSAQWDQ